MRCYTRTGDMGETCIFGGRIGKHTARIDAIGTIDEVNAFLGAAASFSSNETCKRIIREIENDLFTMGAELSAASSGKVAMTARHVERLEALIDKVEEQLPQQRKFIIPAGTRAAMMLNVARAVARRAERLLVKLDCKGKINPELLKYANRLSSLLHVLSRFENNKNSIDEKNPVYHYLK